MTRFHEDWAKNVTSRVLTVQLLMTDDGRRTPHEARRTPDKWVILKAHLEHFVLRPRVHKEDQAQDQDQAQLYSLFCSRYLLFKV